MAEGVDWPGWSVPAGSLRFSTTVSDTSALSLQAEQIFWSSHKQCTFTSKHDIQQVQDKIAKGKKKRIKLFTYSYTVDDPKIILILQHFDFKTIQVESPCCVSNQDCTGKWAKDPDPRSSADFTTQNPNFISCSQTYLLHAINVA